MKPEIRGLEEDELDGQSLWADVRLWHGRCRDELTKIEAKMGAKQNKDPDVVKMVTRMQELKVKSGEISGDAKADKKAAKGKGPKGDSSSRRPF